MPGDDSLDDLGRELRERMGEELRQEAEMVEHDASLVELRRRTLADVALELASRGDLVTAIAGDKSLTGRLAYARGEIALIETSAGMADLHLAAGIILRVDERRPAGGIAPRQGSDTLRARLLEHELANRAIAMWLPGHGVEIEGPIHAVGKDHVIVTGLDQTEWVALFRDVAWVQLR